MLYLLFSVLCYATPNEIEIKEWFLPNEETRKRLTSKYIEEHCGSPCLNEGQYPYEMTPKMVVVHWTAGSTAKSAWHTFAKATLRGRSDISKGGTLNVSSQYLVDRDGTIYQLLPSNRISRHCIGLNHLSIGIENVADGKKYPFTQAQVEANIALIRMLSAQYPITHVIGHHEHNKMEEHPYFQEVNPKYRTVKVDPGDVVMKKIYAGLGDHNLKGPPQPKK